MRTVWTALSQMEEGAAIGGGQNHILTWQLDPINLIWTIYSKDIQLDARNKATGDFFIFLKIQDCRRSKIDQI